MTHTLKLAAATGILLLGLLAGLVPTATASPPINSGWSSQFVTGLNGEDTDYISAKGESGTVGIAFRRVTSQDVGFASGTVATGFSVKNIDIEGGATVLTRPELFKVSETVWVIILETQAPGATVKAFRSTNSGVTWAQTFSATRNGVFRAESLASTIVLTYSTTATTVDVTKSVDGGATWAVIRTQTVTSGFSYGDVVVIGPNEYHLIYATGTSLSGGNVFSSFSSDGGSFWSAATAQTGIPSMSTSVVGFDIGGNWNALSLSCFTSCSVTPQFQINYGYRNGVANTFTTHNFGAVNVQWTMDDAADSNGVDVAVIQQSSGLPTIWFGGTTGAVAQITTPLPDADGTAVPVLQASRIFVPLSNGSFSGRLEVWSAEIPQASGTQVAVTNLVGYSMDNLGQNIIVRTDFGTTIKTYQVNGLSNLATTTTPDCNVDIGTSGAQVGGVNAYAIESDGDNVVYMTYVDCAADGDSDSFKIRTPGLTTPTFPCDEAEPDVDHAGGIVIPENLGYIGTISDLNPSYIDRCNEDILDDASVGWTFSTIGPVGEGGGRIGAAAYTFNEFQADESTDGDADTIIIDSGAANEIQLCSWQNQITGQDYLGGTALSTGTTKIVEVESSVVLGGPLDSDQVPELDFTPVYTSATTYGGGYGLACAQDTVAILKGTQIHVLDNITSGAPDILPGWPQTITGTPTRGLAMTGSGQFIAVVDGGVIEIHARNGTQTGTFPLPTGSFKGMEFSNGGAVLAVFTSTFITVYNAESVTCGTEGDCATQEGVTNNPPICATPPCNPLTPPDDTPCTSFLCVDSTSVPDGFTASTFNLFLGIMLMLAIAVGVYVFTKSALMGAGGLAGGFLISFAFGLIPLWVIVVLVVISVAIIFIRVKGATQGG